jgi:hypothetical protein
MSSVSAKSWGVEQQDIKDLWDSNTRLSSSFGTVVHHALEHYDRFMKLGEIIQEKRELLENYAMPKHPILKSIVMGFKELYKGVGEIIPEALITDVSSGYCGHADRILIVDKENKICRVQDYKINVGSESISSSSKALKPFNELPANKITKYQLQMSFYSNMLEKSGWTVQGLDVFVLEDTWKMFNLEVLKVI